MDVCTNETKLEYEKSVFQINVESTGLYKLCVVKLNKDP